VISDQIDPGENRRIFFWADDSRSTLAS
jgi:hypothetical protein